MSSSVLLIGMLEIKYKSKEKLELMWVMGEWKVLIYFNVVKSSD